MKNYILGAFCVLFLVGCQESQLTSFEEHDAIYFQLEKTDYSSSYTNWDNWLDYKGDSVVYSFGNIPSDNDAYLSKDTIWIQVNVLGKKSASDRKVKLTVDNNTTTAVEGVHYAALNEEYIFPPNVVRTTIPIAIYNGETLGREPYVLGLQLEENGDFILGLEDRTTARIQIYDDYIKPTIWDDKLYNIFGTYSKAKHEVILLTNGGVLLPNTTQEYNKIGYTKLFNMKAPMNAYLRSNEVYDENGNRVQPV